MPFKQLRKHARTMAVRCILKFRENIVMQWVPGLALQDAWTLTVPALLDPLRLFTIIKKTDPRSRQGSVFNQKPLTIKPYPMKIRFQSNSIETFCKKGEKIL